MPSNTAFGPQGFGAVTKLPEGAGINRYGSGVDTWFADCDATGRNSTVLDAAWLNMVTGNLRTVIKEANKRGADIALRDGEMTLLWNALRHMTSPEGQGRESNIDSNADLISFFDASAGEVRSALLSDILSGATGPGTLGDGWSRVAAASAADVAGLGGDENVLIEMGDGTLRRVKLSSIVGTKSSMRNNGNRTLTHTNGDGESVTFREGRTYTVAAVSPPSPEAGDHWFNPTDSVLHEWVDHNGGMWAPLSGGGSGGSGSGDSVSKAGDDMTGNLSTTGLFIPGSFTPATLPSPTGIPGALAYATDMPGAGGAFGPVYSDGTNWRKLSNNSIIGQVTTFTIVNNADGTMSILSAPPAPAAPILTNNADGTMTVEAT